MRCRVLLFAGLKDRVGAKSIEIDVPGEAPTVAEVRAAVEHAHPALGGQPYRVSIDTVYARDDDGVRDGAVLAFIPPVSGG